MNKGTAIVGFLLCFLAGMGLMWGIDHQTPGAGKAAGISAEGAVAAFDDKNPWSDEDAAVSISSKDPTWGSRTAPVTLVLFSDFECPFCSKVEATINQLKETYGPDKLRVVWKNNPLPFHKNARPASLAANTVFNLAGHEAFWKFHKAAFENQRALTPENFEAWAVAAGVDKAKFKAAYDSKQFDAKIDKDMEVGKASGVTGTPASLINGVFLSGAQPVDKFKAVIDEQIKAAEAKKAAGVKADRVYVELTKENKAKNPPPKGRDEQKQDDKTVWKVPVGENAPFKGNANALVTIVLFSDFQCPFCSKVEPTLEEVLKAYPEKVRVVWKDNPLPFHPRAEPAGELAREARAQKGDKGFWAAHDLLFKNQQKLADEDLLGYAKELGLDVDKVKAAITDKKYKAIFDADQDQADELQAQGTPHMFINGRRIVGAQPIDNFKKIIDEELPKAQALLDKGVKPADLYNELIKDGKSPPPPERKTAEVAPADAPFKGGKDAKVALYLFSDFQCPFCSRVEDTIKEVEKNYGDRVKIVWRHRPLPMHKDAPLASEASQEVWKQKGSEAFWKYHDTLFKNQKTPEGLQRAALEKYAEEQGGIDMGKFKAALDKNVHKAFVDAENAAAEKSGVSGTPAAIIGPVNGKEINGFFISGAQPYGKFKKAIEMALKEAAGGAPAPAADTAKKDAPKPPAPAPGPGKKPGGGDVY
ncbi:MAG: thioredoxin domain-containing protein [Polyangiaceae bacterium]|nr:thioredoxin domain-containing protein [Polyangiaceae bacterium]